MHEILDVLVSAIYPIRRRPGMLLRGWKRAFAFQCFERSQQTPTIARSPTGIACQSVSCLCGLVHPMLLRPSPETRSNYFAGYFETSMFIISRAFHMKAWNARSLLVLFGLIDFQRLPTPIYNRLPDDYRDIRGRGRPKCEIRSAVSDIITTMPHR